MAYGDISAPVDSLVWNALATEKPRALHVTGDIYVFSYEEATDQGRVSTVEIDAVGNIGAAVIDTLTYEGTKVAFPDIIQVSANVFAVAYQGVDDDGFLRTFTVNNDGSIDNTVVDTFEFDTTNCRYPRLTHIAGTTYAIAYSYNYTGKIVTVTISDAGVISEPIFDNLIFDATSCTFSETIKIDNNVFAVFYNRNNGSGRVVTLTIADDGSITDPPIDSAEIAAGVLMSSCACQAGEDIYSFAYTKSDYLGYISTIDINGGGNIGATIDTLQFEPSASYTLEPDVLRISATIVCVTYAGVGNDGFMRTIEIDDAGEITDTVMDTLEFDTDSALRPSLMHISGDVYAVFYGGSGFYGTIKTPLISGPLVAGPKHLMIMGIG